MHVEIILKNYRCFSDSEPAKFSLDKGFISFVGANNSGKSTILKFFYEFRDIFRILSHHRNLGTFQNALIGQFPQFEKPSSIAHSDELFCNTNNRDIEICFKFINAKTIEKDETPFLSQMNIIIPRGTQCQFGIELYSNEGKVEVTNEDTLQYNGTKLCIGNKPIIEMSESLQLLKILANTLYIGAFRNIINLVVSDTSNPKYFDIDVGIAFVQAWRNFKMGTMNKDNEDAYKVTKDIEHIFDFSNLEINPSASVDTLKLLINGKSYFLSEVGSGITQFILVLANAAMKKPSYILIDEPELNLHPSLQLDFLTTLGSYASEGVLFATHSIGLARSSADKIYSIHLIDGEKRKISEFEATQNLVEFLGELNFSGYRELGFDKILLVEGPTDVKTIQQFLRCYKIDHKIVILPLGGKSQINGSFRPELEEIKRISENIYVLIDSERTASGEELQDRLKEFIKVCEQAGVKCHVLERRAIENYFTERAVKKAKGDKYHALGPYDSRDKFSPGVSKNENWIIAREMNFKELEASDLGDFLNSL